MAKNTTYFIKFDLIILSVLQKQDSYTYELTKLIEKITEGRIIPKQGTMYPFIYKLLDAGYITSYNVPVGNKMRVYYHLEETGKDYLKKGLEDYYQLVESLDYLFKGDYELKQ